MTEDPYSSPNAPVDDAGFGTTMSEASVRQWTMFIHLGALSGLMVPFGGIILPLVLWQVKKSESPEIDRHGREVMNGMISYFAYTIAAVILSLVLIGIPFLLALAVASLICPIIGGIKANEGVLFRYPLAIRFL